MSHESLATGYADYIQTALPDQIRTYRERIEYRLDTDEHYEMPDEATIMVSRPARWRIAPWNDAVHQLSDVATSAERIQPHTLGNRVTRVYSGYGGSNSRTLVVQISTEGWDHRTPEQIAENQMKRDVRLAEQEVDLLNTLSDAKAEVINTYAGVRDVAKQANTEVWDWIMTHERGEKRGRARAIGATLLRDLAHITPDMPENELHYVRRTIQTARDRGLDTRDIENALRRWLTARAAENHARVRAHRLPDEDDERTNLTDDIPGWDAPVGTSDWLDGITALLERVKARA